MPQPLGVLGGLDDSAAYKVPCAVATTSDMTNTMIGLPVIDGYQTKLGDRILVWMNTDQTTNGIYYIPAGPLPVGVPPPTSTGAWVRAIDFTNTDAVYNGTQALVIGGVTYAGQIFVCGSNRPTFGVTPIIFTLSALAAQAEILAAQAAASAAAASASAAAAAAAAAGTGGVASLVVTGGGTIQLTTSQASAAILSLTGSLSADQIIQFPAGVVNPRLVIIQGATNNGFTVYLQGNAGADTIGIWYPITWTTPTAVIVTPTRVFWAGYETTPPGTYEDLPVVSPVPPGRLICDGSSYATATYDLLFAQIGTTFGGSGSSFNVPDDRGRVLAGADNMGTGAGSAARLYNWTVGQTGGESTHTLTLPEIPPHTHTSLVSTGLLADVAASSEFTSTAGNTGSAGGGNSHQNTQPTRTTLRLIRF